MRHDEIIKSLQNENTELKKKLEISEDGKLARRLYLSLQEDELLTMQKENAKLKEQIQDDEKPKLSV